MYSRVSALRDSDFTPVFLIINADDFAVPYCGEEDWIFASPFFHGKTPYTYQILFRKHILPVIEKISVSKTANRLQLVGTVFGGHWQLC